MSLTTIEAMTQAVSLAGGRMTEEQYLESVCELITASGRETTVKSLKSNAFSASRMDKAGVCRVSVGSSERQVWSQAQADILLAGGVPNAPISNTPRKDCVVSAVRTARAEAAVTAVPVGGSFYGVPRNSPDAVSDLSEYMQSLIPSNRVFVESERQEYRLLANRYRRTLSGDTIKQKLHTYSLMRSKPMTQEIFNFNWFCFINRSFIITWMPQDQRFARHVLFARRTVGSNSNKTLARREIFRASHSKSFLSSELFTFTRS